MFHDNKIKIYKGIIQYLLDSTKFPLFRIANLTSSPLAHLQLIHKHNKLPDNSQTELNLLKLFILYIDMENKRNARRGESLPIALDLGDQR